MRCGPPQVRPTLGAVLLETGRPVEAEVVYWEDLRQNPENGWSMKSALTRELVLDALLMAIWRRRPTQPVTVHSDQGSQYGSDDAVRFCMDHGLIPSMSRRGNCFDNAVAESFFSSLKKERIRKRIFPSREEARADVFDYIEVFYNLVRRHSHLGHVSPHDFEQAALTQA